MTMPVDSSAAESNSLLLIEDDESDVMLVQRALAQGSPHVSISVARDGIEALAILRQEGEYDDARRPDLILLDLNMPRMDGRETLAELKADPELSAIPVVILTTSDAERDILKSYQLHASCYVTKPLGLEEFTTAVQAIRDFWFTVVKLPPR